MSMPRCYFLSSDLVTTCQRVDGIDDIQLAAGYVALSLSKERTETHFPILVQMTHGHYTYRKPPVGRAGCHRREHGRHKPPLRGGRVPSSRRHSASHGCGRGVHGRAACGRADDAALLLRVWPKKRNGGGERGGGGAHHPLSERERKREREREKKGSRLHGRRRRPPRPPTRHTPFSVRMPTFSECRGKG